MKSMLFIPLQYITFAGLARPAYLMEQRHGSWQLSMLGCWVFNFISIRWELRFPQPRPAFYYSVRGVPVLAWYPFSVSAPTSLSRWFIPTCSHRHVVLPQQKKAFLNTSQLATLSSADEKYLKMMILLSVSYLNRVSKCVDCASAHTGSREAKRARRCVCTCPELYLETTAIFRQMWVISMSLMPEVILKTRLAAWIVSMHLRSIHPLQ